MGSGREDIKSSNKNIEFELKKFLEETEDREQHSPSHVKPTANSKKKEERELLISIFGHNCMRCSYDKVVDVHHIDKRHVTLLCPNCHALYHRKKIKIDDVQSVDIKNVKEKVSNFKRGMRHIVRKAIKTAIPESKTPRITFTPVHVKDEKINVKVDDQNVKADVKAELDTATLLELRESGLSQSKIARKYGVSRSAISQRIKLLREKGILDQEGKIKFDVKELALYTKPDKDKYEFQTIRIKVPLKNPDMFDLIKWDIVVPEMKQKFKKFPYFKFTLNRTTKSVILILHKRYIEYPEQVEEICKAYVEWSAEQLKQYDIEIDVEKAQAKGLHLWKRDNVIESNYEKEDGVIGVYHGVDSRKIFPNDESKERKTWCDSSPLPEGIESNDPGYFIDKDAMEVIIGKPKPDQKVPELDIPEYMKTATMFRTTMDNVAKSYDKLDSSLKFYDANVSKHMEWVEKGVNTNENIDASINKLTGVVENLNNTVSDFREEIKSSRKVDIAIERMSKPGYKPSKDLNCPLCGVSFSKRLLLDREMCCPGCFRQLDLYFPSMREDE